MNCLFCKILSGEIPAEVVYESDTAVAFRDINPQAPTHVLVIPRKHVSTINDIGEVLIENLAPDLELSILGQFREGDIRHCYADISKIQWKDFKLPFPAFVIQIPPSLAKLHDLRTGDHDLDTIIVFRVLQSINDILQQRLRFTVTRQLCESPVKRVPFDLFYQEAVWLNDESGPIR